MLFIPTRSAVTAMAIIGLAWPDVLLDLENVESVTPVRGYETRERWCGSRVQAYIEPGTTPRGEAAKVIVSLRSRVRADPDEPHTPVVGVEEPVRGPRVRGRGGSSWPRTWPDFFKRLEQTAPEAAVGRGGKHLSVFLDGQRIATLPISPSDHRGLVNTCLQLRRAGIDVSR